MVVGNVESDMQSISAWAADHILGLQQGPDSTLPELDAAAAVPAIADLFLWDSWPLQHPDGQTARFDGHEYWFMLSSEKFDDPAKRHDHARIRLLSCKAGIWTDCGSAMPDGLAPGTREWAGSAVLDDDGKISLYFTAAGRRGEPHSFEQRLFVSTATLRNSEKNHPILENWSSPKELVIADNEIYAVVNQSDGAPGTIKGFRDPAFFRDPADGREHFLFTGSAAWSDHAYNGVVGLATRNAAGTWELQAPLISAVGLNNELERPHILARDGRYYLFWSTQRHTFDLLGPSGPNGLYAVVADSLSGPWEPVNGSGLVLGNPENEPTQTYSWWVLGEGAVVAFIDHWGLKGRSFEDHPELKKSQFGGTPTPRYRLQFDGDRVTLAD